MPDPIAASAPRDAFAQLPCRLGAGLADERQSTREPRAGRVAEEPAHAAPDRACTAPQNPESPSTAREASSLKASNSAEPISHSRTSKRVRHHARAHSMAPPPSMIAKAASPGLTPRTRRGSSLCRSNAFSRSLRTCGAGQHNHQPCVGLRHQSSRAPLRDAFKLIHRVVREHDLRARTDRAPQNSVYPNH